MKTLLATLLFATVLFTSPAHAVRETGGSPTFEGTVRQTQLGKTILPAIEASLVAQGYESSGPMETSWENEGQSFRAVLWYRSNQSWSAMQIVIKGAFGKNLDVSSIEVMKQNP